MEKTLEIKNLEVVFNPVGRERIKILRGVNLSADKNQSVALVGESGSGKTMTARSVMRLLPGNMRFEKGEILLHGQDVIKLPEKELREIRGRRAGMIFQEPSSYLNPLFTAGSQVLEAVKGAERRGSMERAFSMLKDVGLKENVYYRYPHQLSGGMQQRVMIAMALVNSPDILIADEPTTALDVTTAYGIIELLENMMSKYGLSILFITHDISLAVNFAHNIGVMYAGRVVEFSDAGKILEEPLHPYTERLISCLPEKYRKGEMINVIRGNVPDFRALPQGCAFHPRCPYKMGICLRSEPGEMTKGTATVRCFRYGNSMEVG